MAVRNLPEMPCGPILELNGQRKRFHVPYGLKLLVEEMAREVLKVQPFDINEYLATYLDERVRKKREEEAKRSARKSWQVHRWSWEAHSVLSHEALVEFLQIFHTEERDANHYAIVIQSAYRGYHAREMVKVIRRSMEEERRASLVKELEEIQKLKAAAELLEIHEYIPSVSEQDEEYDENEDEGLRIYEIDAEDYEEEEQSETEYDAPTYDFQEGDESGTEEESLHDVEPIIEEPQDLDKFLHTPTPSVEHLEVEDAVAGVKNHEPEPEVTGSDKKQSNEVLAGTD